MANTLIQIKRSTSTNQPAALNIAEPAYSYSSNTLWLGTSDGLGVIPVGGKYYVDIANLALSAAQSAFNTANSGASSASAYDKANAANVIASAAFDKANSANVLAFNTGIGANAFASETIAGANTAVGTGANAYAAAIGTAGNTYFLTTIAGANTAVGTGANAFTSATIAGANTAVGGGANTVGIAAFAKANAANISAGAAYDAENVTRQIAIAAYANSNTKLSTSGGTITGDLSVTGNLSILGNTVYTNTTTLVVSDPLIYLAANNYGSDIVDIGFVANYVNATGSNVHTGIFRDHESKEYFVFQGYDREPDNNHIDPTGNNFALAVLNAHIRTSNLNLGGVNAITWITSAFDKGNIALTAAGSAFDKANAANVLAFNTGIGANAFASATIAGANTAVGGGANAYAAAIGTAGNTYFLTTLAGANTAVGGGANAYAAAIGTAGNTYFLTTLAGANTAVGTGANTYLLATIAGANTAVGTGANTVGIAAFDKANAASAQAANADFITSGILAVSYGGTGRTTFANNGVLFGNTTSGIRVTAAGTEGQVLQVTDQGTPAFGMLDGGTF